MPIIATHACTNTHILSAYEYTHKHHIYTVYTPMCMHTHTTHMHIYTLTIKYIYVPVHRHSHLVNGKPEANVHICQFSIKGYFYSEHTILS